MPAAVAVAVVAGCVSAPGASEVSGNQAAQPTAEAVSTDAESMTLQIQRFSVKLTSTNLAAINRSDTDLVIIDPTGVDRRDVERLRTQPDGSRRAVVAYINIGEAETYRDYWRSEWNSNPPSWVGPANPNWANHFYTAYWTSEWQAILFGTPRAKLDRILAAGFDGVFMDGVDKYMDWPGRGARAQSDMYALVERIASYARARTPGFLIIPNNAENLLDSARYRSTIDAIVKEDLFFGVPGEGQPNDPGMVSWSLRQLRLATNDGLPVLVIEYVTDPGQRSLVVQRLRENRMLGTFGRSDLASLTLPVLADANAVNQLRSLPKAE
ncbi:MJ1477/TM1410 family putative glycoside hydrolase [Citreimonas salinaria]|nr:MJ1477/TM1410 family putative glycoside hydrolase [Citreimonas salinaria]